MVSRGWYPMGAGHRLTKDARMPKGTTIPLYPVRNGAVEQQESVLKPDEEWRGLLTPGQFAVARKKGTEPAFTGKYHDCKREGVYRCTCCTTDLFYSDAKFDSGTGWPSFSAPVSELNIRTVVDNSHGMIRTEVLCARCGAHLGHVFDDGPPPAGKRYCMNSASLDLRELPP